MKRVLPLVALLALLVRGAALVAQPTPDACEYEMLARSLARGEGFTLPVRVRLDEPGPVRHDARSERAPLFPLFLAAVEPLADDGRGAIAPGLQCANALVGVLDAVLVAALAWSITKDRRVALAAGALAAWSPPLVEASCKLFAEPLGLAFVLLALLARERLVVAGALVGIARLARPESIAAAVLLAPGPGRRARARRALLGVGALVAVGLVALALGAGSPQSFLFRVSNFRDVMFEPKPLAPSAWAFVSAHPGLVARHIGENVLDLGRHALRFAHLVPVLGLVALARRDRVAVTAFALALGAALVWSTQDHVRFLVAPLALLAIPAAIEARRLVGSKGLGIFLAASLVALGVDHARWAAKARAPRPPSVWDVPAPLAERLRALGPGEAFAAVSPWSLALASGRDGLLLPIRLERTALREFLRAHGEVKVVVLRPVAHDARTPEPWSYREDLASVSSSETVGGATLLWLR